MSKFTNFAAAAVVATFAAGAANAVTITNPFDSGPIFDYGMGTLTATETFELDYLTSFDVAFSGTVSTVNVPSFTYSIVDADTASVIASGSFAAGAGPLTNFAVTESFYYDNDFTVTLTGVTTASRLINFTVVSPSAALPAVPLPAGVFLLGGALGALGIARRKKA